MSFADKGPSPDVIEDNPVHGPLTIVDLGNDRGIVLPHGQGREHIPEAHGRRVVLSRGLEPDHRDGGLYSEKILAPNPAIF